MAESIGVPAPTFSIVATVLPGEEAFDELLATLKEQPEWELVLVGPAVDVSRFGKRKVTVVSCDGTWGECAAAGLAAVTADYVLFASEDGRFRKTAVQRLSHAALDGPFDIIYGDDAIAEGWHNLALPKPDFSPERLRSQFYFGPALFFNVETITRLGGLNLALHGAELYDLALRIARSEPRVKHVRQGIFRVQKIHLSVPGDALPATRMALEQHLAETGGGDVESVGLNGVNRTHRPLRGAPLVSVVIPTRGIHSMIGGESRCLVIDAVRSVFDKSTYQNFEMIVVVDSVAEDAVIDELKAIGGSRLKIVWWEHPFNFSAKMNLGVFHSSGEYLLFLNDDTQVITPGWIEPMLALCQLPGAGMTGAMLYFEDDTIQHAGHVYNGGGAGHIGLNHDRGDGGPDNGYLVEREISGVTAACALMPRPVFDEVGGFSLLYPVNFNDVDLSMKITMLGYSIYWTPYSELYHFESKTRVARVAKSELQKSAERWRSRLEDSGYWPYDAAPIRKKESL